MNWFKLAADNLKASFKWVKPTMKPGGGLAMPYGDGCSGLVGYFREGEFENLKLIVGYVKQNIPQSEWRKGMNLIALERKGVVARPNPLQVAMREAEAVLRGYERRQELLKEDYSIYPVEDRPKIPTGLDDYAFEKIEGLVGLVSILNDPSIKDRQSQIQSLKQEKPHD